jgi:hypothetical protein
VVPNDPAPPSGGWLARFRRGFENLVYINRNLEQLRDETRLLRSHVADLTKLVHYQAGQIQQIDLRIRDAVEAQVLRELDRRGAARRPKGEAGPG